MAKQMSPFIWININNVHWVNFLKLREIIAKIKKIIGTYIICVVGRDKLSIFYYLFVYTI